MKSALSIAGSDSSGGAGIQADLKTFSAFGVHGATVITAVTAQDTIGVQGSHTVPADMVARQIESVLGDIPIEAVKTGMLPNAETIEIVARYVRERAIRNLVIDPVMAAQSGDMLTSEGAIRCLRDRLLPLSLVVTPNIHEAQALTGQTIRGLDEMEKAAEAIQRMGARNVLIKGGHIGGDNTGCDLFYAGEEGPTYLRAVKVSPHHDIHGTGCTLSAAIAAGLAVGMPLRQAVEAAKEFITRAIDAAYTVGRGSRLVNPLALSADTHD